MKKKFSLAVFFCSMFIFANAQTYTNTAGYLTGTLDLSTSNNVMYISSTANVDIAQSQWDGYDLIYLYFTVTIEDVTSSDAPVTLFASFGYPSNTVAIDSGTLSDATTYNLNTGDTYKITYGYFAYFESSSGPYNNFINTSKIIFNN